MKILRWLKGMILNREKRDEGGKVMSLRNIWLALALVILLSSLIFWGGYCLIENIDTLRVTRIVINGSRQCSRRDIEEITGTIYGRCILKVSLSDLYQKIKSIGWIKDLSIRRTLPDTLQITISERMPLGILVADRQYLIDKEGVVIAPVRDQSVWNLPVITGLSLEKPKPPPGREIASSSLKSALQVLGFIQDLKAGWLSEISEISLEDPRNIVLFRGDRNQEIRLGYNNLEEKIIYLQAIWNDIRARVSNIEYIDLRYKNQIVVKPAKQIGQRLG